jgi:hypothetical protein
VGLRDRDKAVWYHREGKGYGKLSEWVVGSGFHPLKVYISDTVALYTANYIWNPEVVSDWARYTSE